MLCYAMLCYVMLCYALLCCSTASPLLRSLPPPASVPPVRGSQGHCLERECHSDTLRFEESQDDKSQHETYFET